MVLCESVLKWRYLKRLCVSLVNRSKVKERDEKKPNYHRFSNGAVNLEQLINKTSKPSNHDQKISCDENNII